MTFPAQSRSQNDSAIGFRTHSGWAAAVAVVTNDRVPRVVGRWKLVLSDPKLRGSVQPFHAAESLPVEKAEKLIGTRRQSSNGLAERALVDVITELRAKGCRVVRACILLSSGRPVGSLASRLASHAMIHNAEGEFFRETIRYACAKCSIPVKGIKEREIMSSAAQQLRLTAKTIQQQITSLGQALGPPWRQDEKLAALAGWLALLSNED